MPQAAPLVKSDVIVKLSETDEVVFQADARFVLKDQASILFVFEPGWKPPDKVEPMFGACLLQIGIPTSPGSILDVRVALDLQSITVASDGKTVQLKVDCERGGEFGLFFSNSRVQLWPLRKKYNIALPLGASLTLNRYDESKPAPQMRLGGDGGKKPYQGTIGGIVLLDRDILADLQSASPRTVASENKVWLEGWVFEGATRFFAGSGAERHGRIAKNLVGVAIPGQKRFDFIPREILWPEGRLNRWMLHHGDGQPVKVQLNDVEDQNDHGVYTSNTVYCFFRLKMPPPGSVEGDYPFTVFPCLFADSGLKFLLTYLGNNQFHAQDPQGNQPMLLTYNPLSSTSSGLATMDVECIGWDNTQTHTFATQVCPQGASLGDNVHADTLYPRDLQFTCQPAAYSGLDGGSHPERWDSAFAANPFEYGAAMHGWDITAIDNPLNPLGSRAGGKDVSQYIFNLPTGDDAYRKNGNIATPCYLAAKPIWETSGTDMTQMFRSASECSHKQSFSFGVGASLQEPKAGKQDSDSGTPGLDFSFESVRGQSTKYSEEHAIATSTTVHFAFATMLEKQWLDLSPAFLNDLKEALAKITSLQVPAPGEQYEPLYGVFDYWGTHYANAVTFGFGEYSVGLIDELGASSMTSASTKISVGAKIPVEDVLVKANAAWSNEDSTTNETGSKSELYQDLKIGKEEHAVPIRMDLRPISDLLVPPYMEDWALLKRDHISAAMNRYIQDRKQQPLDGFVLYQARLVSIKNTNPDPCYISARAFVAGAQADKLDIEVPVGDKGRAKSVCLWYGDKLPIDPNSMYTLRDSDSVFASVGIPLSRTDLVPAICLTGFTFNPVMGVLHDLLPDQTGYVPLNPYPTVVATSDQRVKAAVDEMLTNLRLNVDNLGVDWFPWPFSSMSTDSKPYISPLSEGCGGGGTPTYSELVVRPKKGHPHKVDYLDILTVSLLQVKQNFPSALSGDGTAQQLSLESVGLELVLEVRKVDLVDCFSTKHVEVAPVPPPPAQKAVAV